MGHSTFVSKRLSAVGNKRILQFFYSVCEPRSRVIALDDSTQVFLLSGFVQVMENLESHGILQFHFPGLESPEI